MLRRNLLVLVTVILSLAAPASAFLPLQSPPLIIKARDDNNGEGPYGYVAILENGVLIDVSFGFFPRPFASYQVGIGDAAVFATLKSEIEAASALCVTSCPGFSPVAVYDCYQVSVFKPHFNTSPLLANDKPVTVSNSYLYPSFPVLPGASCSADNKDRIRRIESAVGAYYITVTWLF